MTVVEQLLLELFEEDELRRFIARWIPDGEAIVRELPGSVASHVKTTHELVRLLVRRGLVNDEFFAALRTERPQREADIDSAALAWSKRPQGGTEVRGLKHVVGVAGIAAAIYAITSSWPESVTTSDITVMLPVQAQQTADQRQLVDRLEQLASAHPGLARPEPPPKVVEETPRLPTFMTRANPTARRAIAAAADLELVTFSLASSKSALSEDERRGWDWESGACTRGKAWPRRESVCQDPDRLLRHFSANDLASRPRPEIPDTRSQFPIFTVVLKNRGSAPIVVTQMRYRVYDVQDSKGGIGHPLEPTVRYIHEIHYKRGDQVAMLEAPFLIEPGGVGDFELELRPTDECAGCGWLMQVFFIVDDGAVGVATEPFQLWMSKLRHEVGRSAQSAP